MSWTKSRVSEISLSGKWLMYTKNSAGPNTNPCGIPNQWITHWQSLILSLLLQQPAAYYWGSFQFQSACWCDQWPHSGAACGALCFNPIWTTLHPISSTAGLHCLRHTMKTMGSLIQIATTVYRSANCEIWHTYIVDITLFGQINWLVVVLVITWWPLCTGG